MAKVVIFGLQDNSSLAHFYLKHDSEHETVAFTVNRNYLPENDQFEGLPIVAFEDLVSKYPPDDFTLFAPLSHRSMNQIRAAVYRQGKELGYSFISYLSSKATIFPNTPIGDNCFILENNTIQPYTEIGNNVVLWSGNHIGHHSVLKDHLFFSSQVVLSGHCTVEPYSFLGVNATIANGKRIALGTFVGMGSVIQQDTEEWGVYRGNPARKAKIGSKELDF